MGVGAEVKCLEFRQRECIRKLFTIHGKDNTLRTATHAALGLDPGNPPIDRLRRETDAFRAGNLVILR